MARLRLSFAAAFAAAAVALPLAPLPACAADTLPAPIVESFDSIDLPGKWTVGPTVWTSSVTVADSPLVWTAFNARSDSLPTAGAPAVGLQSPNASNKGWLLSDPIPSTLQHVSFSFRQILSTPADFVVYVNGVPIANTRATNDISTVLSFDTDTVDPETGLPFDAPVTLLVSNRITGANLALDDIVLSPRTLFVTLDHPGTNVVYPPGEFADYKTEFDIAATPTLPPDFTLPEGAILDGSWTVTPDFAGSTTPLDSPALTLVPDPADVGTTFALAYTATLALPEDSNPKNPAPVYTHSATAFLTVSNAPVPRFLDFENDATFNFPSNPPATHVLAGHPWSVQNVRTSDTDDKKRGARSLRLRHEGASKPAFLASEFAYPDGIGVLSFRYANYSESNPSLTLVVQAAPEEAAEPDPDDPDAEPASEGWFDLPDATLVVTNHPDIDDFEFRVDAQLDGPHRIRILTTSGVTPGTEARANIDDLRIRPYGSNAPVLVFRGPRAIPALDDWNASFVYLHPDDPGYTWTWSLDGDLPGLAATTNSENDSLDFSLAALPTDTAVRTLTVAVWTNGVVDQQLSIPLSVVSYPTFDLEPASAVVTNDVAVYVRNVFLYGPGTNYSVAWSVDPLFAEGSTYPRPTKSRYTVHDISQTNRTTHVVTAVLHEKATGLETARTVEITVEPDPDFDPDKPGPAPSDLAFTSIVPSPSDSTVTLVWQSQSDPSAATDASLAVSTNLAEPWPDPALRTNSPATLPLPPSPAFFRLVLP